MLKIIIFILLSTVSWNVNTVVSNFEMKCEYVSYFLYRCENTEVVCYKTNSNEYLQCNWKPYLTGEDK